MGDCDMKIAWIRSVVDDCEEGSKGQVHHRLAMGTSFFFFSPPGKFGTLFGYIPIIMSRRLYKRIKYFPKNYASLFFLREQKFDYIVNGCLLFFSFSQKLVTQWSW